MRLQLLQLDFLHEGPRGPGFDVGRGPFYIEYKTASGDKFDLRLELRFNFLYGALEALDLPEDEDAYSRVKFWGLQHGPLSAKGLGITRLRLISELLTIKVRL